MKNNSKKIFLGTLLVFLTILGLFLFYNYIQSNNSFKNTQREESPKEADYSASFAIYTNGTFRVFTDAMYHNLSKEAYINAGNPNIVFVKKPNLKWSNFFNTLPFELNENCLTTGTGETFCSNNTHTLQFYLNGVFSPNALSQIIKPGDKLLVTYDRPNAANIYAQISSIPVK